jgi:hypothetical protein
MFIHGRGSHASRREQEAGSARRESPDEAATGGSATGAEEPEPREELDRTGRELARAPPEFERAILRLRRGEQDAAREPRLPDTKSKARHSPDERGVSFFLFHLGGAVARARRGNVMVVSFSYCPTSSPWLWEASESVKRCCGKDGQYTVTSSSTPSVASSRTRCRSKSRLLPGCA